MALAARVERGLYKDSVVLMRVAEALTRLAGVREAAVLMGTPANKDVLDAAGRLTGDAKTAGPEDLVIVVETDDSVTADTVFAHAADLLTRGAPVPGAVGVTPDRPRSAARALARWPDATLVAISTPGAYAGAEALKALRRGRHVFLFSDHVPVEQEVMLKQLAEKKGLLVMGPDCGTAIIAGTPLGFANAVRRGRIGLVGASGTGLQQVSCLVHQLGAGVSHVIGTGSRDLSDAVGGVTMRQGIDALARDPMTDVIVLVSKPPSPAVAGTVLTRAVATGKPVVVMFLGGDAEAVSRAGAVAARSLEEAARAAVVLARAAALNRRLDLQPAAATMAAPVDAVVIARARARLRRGRHRIRGLYSGGTLATEARLVWRHAGVSDEHTVLDMGGEEFTAGRPHPMIDYRARIDRMRREASDPAVAVLLLDVVLGFGAHPDPAEVLVPVVRDTVSDVIVVGSICGTEDDPQRAPAQAARLRDAGMILAPSNAAAAALAAAIVGAAS
ncbi:MAG: acyl-CoA synthetase FdrA [Candidatus Rokubacteria bacterium]|nr:acyl-CoA synthetase FdrA [Candidatus Rokubacteria bacterium]